MIKTFDAHSVVFVKIQAVIKEEQLPVRVTEWDKNT